MLKTNFTFASVLAMCFILTCTADSVLNEEDLAYKISYLDSPLLDVIWC